MSELQRNDVNVISTVNDFARSVRDRTEITSVDDYASLAAQLVDLRRAKEYVDQRKDEITGPAKALQKTAKEWFGATEKSLDETERHLKSMLGSFVQKRVGQASAAAAAALATGDIQGALEAIVAVPSVPGLSLRSALSFEVLDEEAVPEQFWRREINVTAVKTALRGGVKIPGIQAKTEVALAISTKGSS